MLKIPRPDALRILHRLADFQQAMDTGDIAAFDVTTLQGHDSRWRLRVGDYRVVYTVERDELVVWVLAAGNRRDAYRGLSVPS